MFCCNAFHNYFFGNFIDIYLFILYNKYTLRTDESSSDKQKNRRDL